MQRLNEGLSELQSRCQTLCKSCLREWSHSCTHTAGRQNACTLWVQAYMKFSVLSHCQRNGVIEAAVGSVLNGSFYWFLQWRTDIPGRKETGLRLRVYCILWIVRCLLVGAPKRALPMFPQLSIPSFNEVIIPLCLIFFGLYLALIFLVLPVLLVVHSYPTG